jgi:hypothetical protein
MPLDGVWVAVGRESAMDIFPLFSTTLTPALCLKVFQETRSLQRSLSCQAAPRL